MQVRRSRTVVKQACVHRVAELNPYVTVNAHTGALDAAFLSSFQVVVMTNAKSTSELTRVSTYCHDNRIAFCWAETRGLFGTIFTDFGDSFVVVDTNGEEPERHIISSISQVLRVQEGGGPYAPVSKPKLYFHPAGQPRYRYGARREQARSGGRRPSDLRRGRGHDGAQQCQAGEGHRHWYAPAIPALDHAPFGLTLTAGCRQDLILSRLRSIPPATPRTSVEAWFSR